MPIQTIVQKPNKVLQTKTPVFTEFQDPSLLTLVEDMKKTMLANDGVGIAAPQIGVSKRIFVIHQDFAPKIRILRMPISLVRPFVVDVFINPTIIQYSQETEIVEEGCLSVQGKIYPTPRSRSIILKAQTIKGHPFQIQAQEMLARILQHETDHLDGMLYIDRIYEKLNQ